MVEETNLRSNSPFSFNKEGHGLASALLTGSDKKWLGRQLVLKRNG
jgi:hypothetical protein